MTIKPGTEVRFKWRKHWMYFSYGIVTQVVSQASVRVQIPGQMIAQIYITDDLEPIPPMESKLSMAPMISRRVTK